VFLPILPCESLPCPASSYSTLFCHTIPCPTIACSAMPFHHGYMARGGHGLPKVSLGPTMPYLSTQVAACRVGGLRLSSTHLDTPLCMPLPFNVPPCHTKPYSTHGIPDPCHALPYLSKPRNKPTVMHLIKGWRGRSQRKDGKISLEIIMQ
jgi:hypothetical protein